jgi:hypothetical protein
MRRVEGYRFGQIEHGLQLGPLALIFPANPVVILDLGDKYMTYPVARGLEKTANRLYRLCEGAGVEDEYAFMMDAIARKNPWYGKIDKVLMYTGESKEGEVVKEILAFPSMGSPRNLNDVRTAVMTVNLWDSEMYMDDSKVSAITPIKEAGFLLRSFYDEKNIPPEDAAFVLVSFDGEKPPIKVGKLDIEDLAYLVRIGFYKPLIDPDIVNAYSLPMIIRELYEKSGVPSFPRPDSMTLQPDKPFFDVQMNGSEYTMEPMSALLLAKMTGCDDIYVPDDVNQLIIKKDSE